MIWTGICISSLFRLCTNEKYFAVDLDEMKDDYMDATGESRSTLDIVYTDSEFRRLTEQTIDQVLPP